MNTKFQIVSIPFGFQKKKWDIKTACHLSTRFFLENTATDDCNVLVDESHLPLQTKNFTHPKWTLKGSKTKSHHQMQWFFIRDMFELNASFCPDIAIDLSTANPSTIAHARSNIARLNKVKDQ